MSPEQFAENILHVTRATYYRWRKDPGRGRSYRARIDGIIAKLRETV